MGLTGMTEAGRDFLSAWEEYRTEVDEYRELDDERVLVLLRRRGRGKTSGLELGQMTAKGAGLFHVRGGKVTRLVNYFDRERALAELGPSLPGYRRPGRRAPPRRSRATSPAQYLPSPLDKVLDRLRGHSRAGSLPCCQSR
jgi:hypothetical protein